MKLHPFLTLAALPSKDCPHCHGTGKVPDEKAIGQKARQEREAKGLSLRAVARRLALSAPYISDLEKGRRNWTAGMFARYRKVLSIGLALAALATVAAADTTTNNAPRRIDPITINLPTYPSGLNVGIMTNRVTNVLSVLSTTPVPGNCPECGALNHHMAQVRLLSAYDVVYLTATSPGHSNTMQIATGSATNWVSTNLIPRTAQPYSIPGWDVRPLGTNNFIPLNR